MASDIREALTAAGASALVQKIIDPQLLEYQRRYAPLLRSIPAVKWNSDVYYYNTRTVNPNGGNVVDGGARPLTQSTYVQNQFQMKHFQTVGAVTGYAENVTSAQIGNLRAREIEGSIQGMYWDVETSILWGNSAATAFGAYPQFDGLDSQIQAYSGSSQNSLDKAGATFTLASLDELIDMVETQAAMGIFDSSWMFVMSPTMQSKVAQVLQAQQRFNDKVEVAAGLLVPTYRDIPIVKTSFLASRSMQVGTVTTATATTTGVIPASTTYNYSVSAVIARQGEIAGSVVVNQATGSGTGTNTITLSFTPPTGVDGLSPVLYKVYRGAAAADGSTIAKMPSLLGVVDATVGLSADGITPILTTSIVDTGTTLIPQNGATQPQQYPATYVNGNTSKFAPLLSGASGTTSTNQGAGNTESIYLMARDENFICRPYVRDCTPVDIFPTTSSPDSLPYALVSDTTLAVRAPKYLGTLSRVGTLL